MNEQSKNIFIVILIVALGVGGWSIADQKKTDQSLSEKIANLEKIIETLTSNQEEDAAALKELENRQVVRQQSQDDLLTAAVAKAAPAVVSIVISKDVPKLEVVYQNPFGNDPFFKDFGFQVPVYRQKGVEHQKVGAGSGFLITSDGYILTNKHVVADEQADYTALLANGKQLPAKVIYKDPDNDIAIIKIDGAGYGTVSLGDSVSLKLGQSVVAIGNALGEYNNSASVGIISGLDRTIEASGERLTGVIQTDAAINPGNSGGPLLDLNGRAIGVNVATVLGSSNISFSIPINVVKGIVKKAIDR